MNRTVNAINTRGRQDGLLKFDKINITLFYVAHSYVCICHMSQFKCRLSTVCMMECNVSHFSYWIDCIALVLSNRLYNAATPDSMVLNYSKIVGSSSLDGVCEE